MPSDSHTERVAANVRAEMARGNHKQEPLAETIGMKQQALSRRLSGRTPFTVDELARLSRVFGVPMSHLLGEAVA